MQRRENRLGAAAGGRRRLDRRAVLRAGAGSLLLGAVGSFAAACAASPSDTERGTPRRIVIATGAAGGVYYPYGSGIANLLSQYMRGVQATAEITSASVDNLQLLRDGAADVAFTQADTLYDATKAQGPFATGGRIPALALATLYMEYTHLVTLGDRGLQGPADLRGRNVALGPAGSGTEIVARRLLDAFGFQIGSDVQAVPRGIGPAVEGLRAGEFDAVFWLGGLPSTAILDLATTPGARLQLLPTAEALPRLRERFGPSLYHAVTIPRTAYPGLPADVSVLGVANLLVVHERLGDALVHRMAQVLFEHQAELAAIHLEARHLAPAAAVIGSPATYHPGAVRLYRDLGVWAG